MGSFFVTGGSGFIGGRLIERLHREGHSIRALARSETAAAVVTERGAQAVAGELGDQSSMRAAAEGCEFAVHAAATLGDWGEPEEFERGNVIGTENALRACADAGVRRFVHVGTEAALMAGRPLVNVDETAPLRPDSPALYSATKARAEQAVRAANSEGFETVVVRPRFVWGTGDNTLLPSIVELVKSGRFAWIAGGRHLTSTTHVENTVEGLVLGAHRGRPGEVYFVTDGDPVVFREFVTQLLREPGCAGALAQPPEAARRSPRRRRRGGLAAPAATRPPAADPLRLLGLLAGVHDQDRQGARGARLRPAQEHLRGARRAAWVGGRLTAASTSAPGRSAPDYRGTVADTIQVEAGATMPPGPSNSRSPTSSALRTSPCRCAARSPCRRRISPAGPIAIMAPIASPTSWPIMIGRSQRRRAISRKPAWARISLVVSASAIEKGPGPQVGSSYSSGRLTISSTIVWPRYIQSLSIRRRHTTITSLPPGFNAARTLRSARTGPAKNIVPKREKTAS